MSRIGKLPIQIPDKVQVTFQDGVVTVKGKLGELTQKVDPSFKIKIENNILTIERPSDEKEHRSLHGLYRSLINNMVIGVSQGWTIKQEVIGVGYKAEANGQLLTLTLG